MKITNDKIKFNSLLKTYAYNITIIFSYSTVGELSTSLLLRPRSHPLHHKFSSVRLAIADGDADKVTGRTLNHKADDQD